MHGWILNSRLMLSLIELLSCKNWWNKILYSSCHIPALQKKALNTDKKSNVNQSKYFLTVLGVLCSYMHQDGTVSLYFFKYKYSFSECTKVRTVRKFIQRKSNYLQIQLTKKFASVAV